MNDRSPAWVRPTVAGLADVCRQGKLRHVDLEAGCLVPPDGDVPARGGNGPFRCLRFSWTADNGVASTCPGNGRRYLVASITKPVVALMAVQLVAEGRLSLNERVGDLVAEFNRPAWRRMTLRHLLTHTGGLPDMLPDNASLRARHAPLEEFIRASADVPPEFAAGTDCRYASMGFAVLGDILHRVTGIPLPQLLKERLFEPLGMTDSWLGVPPDIADTVLPGVLACRLPVWQPADADWNWNSRYWRTLGAPWGGLISTASDLGRLARMLLQGGRNSEGQRILSNSAISAALTNQTRQMTELPEAVRRHQRWGLGWRLNWPHHAAAFGDLVPADTVGHWGATGTLMWLSPSMRQYAVLLTTDPYEHSLLAIQKLSNIICSWFSDTDV